MRLPWLLTLPLLSHTILSHEEPTHHAANGVCVENFSETCSLYLAPSTIPNAGLGVFTTKPLSKGDLLLPTGELDIPIVDLLWHNNKMIFWPFSRYTWNKRKLSGEDVHARNEIQIYGTGFDSVLNAHMLLKNSESMACKHDLMSLKLGRDAGASGITPYWNNTYQVIRDVPAGGELFSFYGEIWCVMLTASLLLLV